MSSTSQSSAEGGSRDDLADTFAGRGTFGPAASSRRINELDGVKEDLHEQFKTLLQMEMQAARKDVAKQTKVGLQDEAMKVGEKVREVISNIFRAGFEDLINKVGALEVKVDAANQKLNDMANKGVSEHRGIDEDTLAPEEGLAAQLDKIQLDTSNKEGPAQQKSLALGGAASAPAARAGEQAGLSHTTSSFALSLDNEQAADREITATTSSAQHAESFRAEKSEEGDAGAPTGERARTEEGHGHDDDEAGQ